ncbi:hypothetical protein CC86DRAFT_388900 [Ophiobolus disseminans]|uniref:Uncharacterized protein n=1 Tax=Ophiobolus disseminans TaxID=1469910 RepID=A0A6A6ZBE8_9PLEO|nr:hypothetical protein CC86DRAFT_388900 [Ophiobolus disseminans]
MSGNVVFVTSYDFITVYPSAPAATALSSQQNPSPSVTSAQSDIHSTVLSAISSSAPPGPSTNPFPVAPAYSHTPLSASPRPSGRPISSPVASPDARPEPKGGKNWSPDVVALFLVAIILIALIVLCYIAYALVLRLHKGCPPECKYTKAELQKYKDGDLRPITPAMVGAREGNSSRAIIFSPPFGTADLDVERSVTSNFEADEKVRHDAATAALDAPDASKPSLWTRTKGAFVSKGKQRQSADSRRSVSSGSTTMDRYSGHGTPFESREQFHPPGSVSYEPAAHDSNHLYAGPAHSHISAPNDHQIPPHGDYDVSPSTYSTYLNKVVVPRETEAQRRRDDAMHDRTYAVSSSLNIRDQRRLGGYGGLGMDPQAIDRRSAKVSQAPLPYPTEPKPSYSYKGIGKESERMGEEYEMPGRRKREGSPRWREREGSPQWRGREDTPQS